MPPDQSSPLQQAGYDAGTAAIAVVHEQLRNLNAVVSEVKTAVVSQAEQLGKLAVIEERNLVINQALQRAFGEITQTNERVAALIAREQAFKDLVTADFTGLKAQLHTEMQGHKDYVSRWINRITGFVAAISFVGALGGWWFTDVAKTVIQITQAYKYGGLQIMPTAPRLPSLSDREEPKDEK